MNVAARLCDCGEAGQILVGPDVWLAVRHSARAKSLGVIDLKGKGPIDVVECTAVR